ncbi:exodeoxyribonuclease V subunit beta [Balneatrix alpica]|uniref:RecBCD enzyme subunit RecB n=1 Tax=Balneatrix alpica TaxID=75684 RepID=A0ABV5Z8T5_9GAMM|nr:exodeoxyribonuclease V subunit beta [Balneatrix alpica]
MSSVNILDASRLPLQGLRLIEASAGTGKTYTITTLFLRLLLGLGEGGSAHPRPLKVDEILVVTFTRAATEELRGRIRDRIAAALYALQQGQPEPLLAALDHAAQQQAVIRLRQALSGMDQAAIFTIHGFCQRMLAEFAFESGSQFELEFSEQDANLRLHALQDCWRHLIYPLSEPQAALVTQVLSGPDSLDKQLRAWLGRMELQLLPASQSSWLELIEAYLQAWQQLQQQWDAQAMLEWFDTLALDRRSYSKSNLPKWVEKVSQALQGPARLLDKELPLERFSYTGVAAKLKSGSLPPHPVLQIAEQLLQLDQQLRAQCWREALLLWRQRLQQHKQALQVMAFDDLLQQLQRALHQTGGEVLAAAIRRRYPLAMIDEFQDTDPLQYQIFTAIYPPACLAGGEQGLLLIGDPKQAIYAFRGADIFTYLQARRWGEQLQALYTLDTNWRSATPLVEAVNHLFAAQPAPFVYAGQIPFHPVKAAGKADAEPLLLDGQAGSQLLGWQLPADNEEAASLVAWEIKRLLWLAEQGQAKLAGRHLQANDIAILVRSARQAQWVRAALQQQGIASAYVSRESVFASQEARELALILAAVQNPWHQPSLRAALATLLLGASAAQLDAWLQDEQQWQGLVDEFVEYQGRWQQQGVLAMLRSLIFQRQLASRWLVEQGGERRLTNVLHLGELLQQASKRLVGPAQLLQWLQQCLADPEREGEVELRLESERQLVQIFTIHRSKGLEFPVVFIPYSQWPLSSQGFHLSHDEDYRACLHLDGEGKEEARREQLAEDVRLLYVALTRASQRCYLGFNPEHTKDNALAWLLEADAKAELKSWQSWQLPGWQYAEAQWPSPQQQAQWRLSQPDTDALAAAQFTGQIERDWKVTSYTELSRQHSDKWGLDDWQVDVEVLPERRPVEPDPTPSAFSFPRGAQAGTWLHSLFERVDFRQPAQLHTLLREELGLLGLDEQWLQPVQQWLQAVLQTPLTAAGCGLAQLAPRQCNVEMEFYLPIQRLRPRQLQDCIARHWPLASQGPQLASYQVQGMVRGFIDLVFEHQGRYYLLDYKSNHLGEQAQDYLEPALALAMQSHRYDVQLALYQYALHAYLQQRLPHYQPQQHLGGAYYLFLRGMNGQADSPGVFYQPPSFAMLDDLARLFNGELPAAQDKELNHG